MGKQYTITMGAWQFLQPDISNVVHLAGLYCGEEDALADLEQDKQRRQAKAAMLRQFSAGWKEVEHKLAYLLKDAETIKLLEPTVNKALVSIEEEAEWLADGRSS